ncbi:MAG: hypothetical protein ACK56I_20130, partial [bacterium]
VIAMLTVRWGDHGVITVIRIAPLVQVSLGLRCQRQPRLPWLIVNLLRHIRLGIWRGRVRITTQEPAMMIFLSRSRFGHHLQVSLIGES